MCCRRSLTGGATPTISCLQRPNDDIKIVRVKRQETIAIHFSYKTKIISYKSSFQLIVCIDCFRPFFTFSLCFTHKVIADDCDLHDEITPSKRLSLSIVQKTEWIKKRVQPVQQLSAKSYLLPNPLNGDALIVYIHWLETPETICARLWCDILIDKDNHWLSSFLYAFGELSNVRASFAFLHSYWAIRV